MILTLSIILFLLLAFINKSRGIKTFYSLYINYFFIIIVAVLISLGLNPIIVALTFSLASSAFILFYLNGFNIKTKIAYASVILVLLVAVAFIMLIGHQGNLNGFGTIYDETFIFYSIYLNVNFVNIAIAIILISLTGAITDTSLNIATCLNEVYENNKNLSFLELIACGRNMGFDILGTMINTLFFVFAAEFLAFFIFYYDRNLTFIINDRLFLQEVSKLLIGALGCILIIPITILFQSFLLRKKLLQRH